MKKAYGMFIDTWIPIHTKIMYSLILQQTPRCLITTGPSIKFTGIEFVTTYEQKEDKLPVLVFGTKQVDL